MLEVASSLLVLLLDTTLALGVDEAASGASALLAAEEGLLGSSTVVVLSNAATNAV